MSEAMETWLLRRRAKIIRSRKEVKTKKESEEINEGRLSMITMNTIKPLS